VVVGEKIVGGPKVDSRGRLAALRLVFLRSCAVFFKKINVLHKSKYTRSRLKVTEQGVKTGVWSYPARYTSFVLKPNVFVEPTGMRSFAPRKHTCAVFIFSNSKFLKETCHQ
jgi:hypothetical protein